MAFELRLGDKLESIIATVVPNKIITAIQKKEGGCGCAKRKAALNSLDEIFK
jgi:hypothetical protein